MIINIVGEIFLLYMYASYVNDISRNFVVQVIQVLQLIQVIQVRLAHLWPDFQVILFFNGSFTLRWDSKAKQPRKCKFKQNWFYISVVGGPEFTTWLVML